MAGIITIACPGCEATFDIPQELGGQLGECTECGTIFEIPVVEAAPLPQEEVPVQPELPQQPQTATQPQPQQPTNQSPQVQVEQAQKNLSTTETGTIKGTIRDDIGEATNTVKLSRTGVGMIPQVKDNFNFEVVKKPVNQQSKTKTFRHTRRPSSGRASGVSKNASKKKTNPPKKKWWQFWMFWKSA